MTAKAAVRALKLELAVWQRVARDPRTPRAARWLLGAGIGYLVMPFDVIPDFIPVVGYLDDAIIVGGSFLLARRMIPEEVIRDARAACQ
ncbi:MAG TPA: YkvA family protein [Armatimonadota bacterium]|jgi:uncharacterized membrane protein YkvA (DUF1232 family)